MKTTPAQSSRLRKQTSKDTLPEMRLRRLLHKAGFRYRVHYPVPGMPRRSIDVAFPGRRLAVFIDGCFWHSCPEHGTASRTNTEYWRPKLEQNRKRDADTDRHLFLRGWQVLRVWEHESSSEACERVTALFRVGSLENDHAGNSTKTS